MAASVRNRMEILMIEKFRKGMLLHNPETKEDGLVKRVYQTDQQTMYEVWVPAERNTWLSGHYTYDWAERNVKLSANAELKSKPDLRNVTYGRAR
jgi:hypothetical protein